MKVLRYSSQFKKDIKRYANQSDLRSFSQEMTIIVQ